MRAGSVTSVTRAGVPYTITPFISSAGEACWRAKSVVDPGESRIPLAIFCHGKPGAEAAAADDQFQTGYREHVDWLMDHGWAFVEGHGAGAHWGNQAARDAYEAMYTDVAAVWDIGPVVVIGRSMGALVGAWLAAQSPVVEPACAGFVSLSGTVDLTNRYSSAHGTDLVTMNAAYSVSNESQWRAAVGPFDPLRVTPATWDGRNAMMQGALDDATVPWAANGRRWDERYGARLRARRTAVSATGGHGASSRGSTQIAATLAFMADAIARVDEPK